MPSTSAHSGVPEMTIGSIVFRVAEGDITKEEGDAIVNITNQAFNLKAGILIDIMCEKSKCDWKGWERRGASIFPLCFKPFYLFHCVVSVLLLRVQKFNAEVPETLSTCKLACLRLPCRKGKGN